ncbi:MAG TPA: ferritin-like fold-containing protein [Actinomycetota bacterium]
MNRHDDLAGAVADVVGGLCYALLRVYQVTAAGTAGAPTVGLAERQASFADDEYARYVRLRSHLDSLTSDPEAALEAFRPAVDAFYGAAAADDWTLAQVFHYVGDTITTDFADILTSRLPEPTASAVRDALTGRTEQEEFALDQIRSALKDGRDAQQSIRRHTAVLVGEALNRFRDALLASNRLETVLGGDAAVKEVVLELLGRHRERLEHLGIDTVDD